MDKCIICGSEFRRKYRRKGEKKTFCSKKCAYKARQKTYTCKTCNSQFTASSPRKNTSYCSLACTERSPCQICGTIITGRAKFQSGARRFCSRHCASIGNATLSGKKNYVVRGFAATIKRTGKLACEKCGENESIVLVVHHLDRNRSNNEYDNLQTLCANCHHRVHRESSVINARQVKNASFLATVNHLA